MTSPARRRRSTSRLPLPGDCHPRVRRRRAVARLPPRRCRYRCADGPAPAAASALRRPRGHRPEGRRRLRPGDDGGRPGVPARPPAASGRSRRAGHLVGPGRPYGAAGPRRAGPGLQDQLRGLGAPVTRTAFFDATTRSAVIAQQRRHGLPGDGVVARRPGARSSSEAADRSGPDQRDRDHAARRRPAALICWHQRSTGGSRRSPPPPGEDLGSVTLEVQRQTCSARRWRACY
jgi:hypothetical protein